MIGRRRLGDKHLFFLIVILWLIFLNIPKFENFLPADFWFEPVRVFVHDAEFGTCPRIEVDREIHRAFKGEWIVTLRRLTKNGEIYVDSFTNTLEYTPASILPSDEDLNLSWWTWQGAGKTTACTSPIEIGTYLISTAWYWKTSGGVYKKQQIYSAPFKIGDL